MNGIVVTVNEVVDDPGMARILRKDLFEHSSGAHIGREITALLSGAKNSESIESSGIDIVRKLAMDLGQNGLVTAVTLFSRALAEQHFDTLQVELLTSARSFGKPRLHGRCQMLQTLAAGGHIFFVPHRMTVRHGFAPVGHRELRSGFLRLAKVVGSVVILKIVKLRQAVEKVGLRR